jgi:hypothetical protein
LKLVASRVRTTANHTIRPVRITQQSYAWKSSLTLTDFLGRLVIFADKYLAEDLLHDFSELWVKL